MEEEKRGGERLAAKRARERSVEASMGGGGDERGYLLGRHVAGHLGF